MCGQNLEKNCAHGSCSLQSAIEGDPFSLKSIL